MNGFKVTFINTIRRHFRDATPLIMQVISPILMIIIFGSMFSGNFNSSKVIKPLKVEVVNYDKGQPSQQFIEFLRSGNLMKFIEISQSSDITSAKQLLKENKLDGVIEIKNDFTKKYVKGKYNGIETYMIKNDKTTYQILSSIIGGWRNNNAAIQIGLKSGETMDTIIGKLNIDGKIIVEKPLSSNGRLPRAIDYYSVTIAVMQLIFTGFLSMGKIQIDFLSDMKLRFQSAPANVGAILTGALMGTTVLGFLQIIALVLFSHFVYGANWGSNWGVVLGTLFIMTLFGQLLAAAMTLGMRNANAPQGIIGALGIAFMFLAGGIYTSPIGGAVGKFLLTYGTPNSLAQTAIFGSIYGGSGSMIFKCMGILTMLSIILLGLTINFAKRRVL
jgi:ABC-2 type transport system permease protein